MIKATDDRLQPHLQTGKGGIFKELNKNHIKVFKNGKEVSGKLDYNSLPEKIYGGIMKRLKKGVFY